VTYFLNGEHENSFFFLRLQSVQEIIQKHQKSEKSQENLPED